ncbi:MFS transporter [Bradyrhizobium sp. BWA-3-5]|uniref:MFS transporter n=1 Tax=Bradyrhizobium sp. BWA-3-5 TaxID=3080013 RepID=UPI00293EAFC9|nr:MFS transporter [Bradyrhizobium sp. BWA-3-5]WOH63745.1 MFS transporter [Bradyrhizobium sp. BWA-3-5]
MSKLALTDVGPTTTFAPLKNATFRSIWLANQVSSLGTLMQSVAVGWLMATIATSDLMVALVQAASALPAAILSVIAGAVADNFNRRRVMLAAQWLMMIASALLTGLTALGIIHPWLILGFSFLIGCGSALNNPAWQASVGDIVSRRNLPSAVTLISVGFNTVRSVGPALGGIVVASFGPLIAFVLNTVSYLVPLWVISCRGWKIRSSSLPRESMLTAVYDGIRFTAISSDIKTVLARGCLFGLTSTSILSLLPLFVRDQLGAGPLAYGTLMAGFGTGAFIGGISNGVLRRLISQNGLIQLACIACAVCTSSLAMSPPLAFAAVALALGGSGWVVAWSGLNVSVQLASPRWIVGRTISIYHAFTFGGIAAGSWLWGSIAQHYSLTWSLGIAGSALLLAAAAGYILPIKQQRMTNLDPLDQFEAPALALDLKPRSGPIVVKVEYIIADENVNTFLKLMSERRRVQSRAGARHWTLLRNIQRPSQWTETYRTPTWTDYLRQNHRLTAADKDLEERIRALHAGGVPPRFELLIERSAGAAHKSDPSTSTLSPH